MDDIYDYIDYRLYLLDWKDENELTHDVIVKESGLQSRSSLRHMIRGRRVLASENIVKLGKFIGHNEDELNYFFALVGFNDSTNKREKAFYKQMMTMIKWTI